MNLSARSFWIIGLIALAAIIGQWLGGGWSELWRLPAAVFILALLAEGVKARRAAVPVERHIERIVHLGRPSTSTLAISNHKDHCLNVETMETFPDALSGEQQLLDWNVPPQSLFRQTTVVIPQRLGQVKWRGLYTRILGRMGLAWWRQKPDLKTELNVVPDRLHGNELMAGSAQQGQLNRRVAGGGHELLGLRDYQQGDPLRSIDWKATARQQRCTVRVFSEAQHLDLVVMIDAGRTSALRAGSLTRVGHFVNIAARLIEKAIHNNDQAGLIVYSDEPIAMLPPVRGLKGLIQARRILENTMTQARESNPLAAIMQMRRLVRHRSLVVILTDLDEGDAAGQLVKATSLITPQHMPLIAGILDEEVADLTVARAKHWLDPYRNLAAREAIHSTHRTVLQLRRLGSVVVTARPANLDSAVLGHYERLRSQRRV